MFSDDSGDKILGFEISFEFFIYVIVDKIFLYF